MDEHIPRMNTEHSEGEVDVEGAFGEHDIAYWVREGNRLVPATPTQIAAIQEHEALLRLAQWRTNASTHPLHISHLRHIGLHMRHWLSLLLHAHSRLPNTRHIVPAIDRHPNIPLSETQQQAARERPR